ncbi:hypothetical protein J2W17_004373 [Pseudomonas lini]|nr:hypothetical protein [Pseudomonas lini]
MPFSQAQCASIVGASLLAMDSRAPRLASKHAFPLTTIVSKLAPTISKLNSIMNQLERFSRMRPLLGKR